MKKILFVFLFASLFMKGEVSSQICGSCPNFGQPVNKVLGFKTLSSFQLGYFINNECFVFAPGSVLYIDVPVFFSGCTFNLDFNSTIQVGAFCEFSGATSEIWNCAFTDIAVNVLTGAELNAHSLEMIIGGPANIGIKAGPNSTVRSIGGLDLSNCVTGVEVDNANLVELRQASMNVIGTGINSPADYPTIIVKNSTISGESGVVCGGKPKLEISDKSTINADKSAVKCEYTSGFPKPTLKLDGATFNTGTGSPADFFDIAVELVKSSGTPLLFDGNPQIKNCKVNSNYQKTGITVSNIEELVIEDNTVNLSRPISSPLSYGIYIEESEKTELLGNTISYVGNPSMKNCNGLSLYISPDCVVENNVFVDLTRSVEILGDCESPGNFRGNSFQGNQLTAVTIDYLGKIGAQPCHTNRWETDFTGTGMSYPGTSVNDNLFTANQGSNPVYHPPGGSPNFQFNFGCTVLQFKDKGSGSVFSFGNPNYGNGSSIAEIYPNPSDGVIKVRLNESSLSNEYRIIVSDINGKTLQEMQLLSGRHKEEYQFENLASGVYLVHILDGVQKQTEKLIVLD